MRLSEVRSKMLIPPSTLLLTRLNDLIRVKRDIDETVKRNNPKSDYAEEIISDNFIDGRAS